MIYLYSLIQKYLNGYNVFSIEDIVLNKTGRNPCLDGDGEKNRCINPRGGSQGILAAAA